MTNTKKMTSPAEISNKERYVRPETMIYELESEEIICVSGPDNATSGDWNEDGVDMFMEGRWN